MVVSFKFSKTWLIIGFMIPVVALMAMVAQNSLARKSGIEVVLPIEGYDPRNLLSGHYVTYRVLYSDDRTQCYGEDRKAIMCLNQVAGRWQGSLLNDSASATISRCHAHIVGRCQSGRFSAGIERFFIPEQFAMKLDKAVRAKQGELILSVSPQGKPIIKDLRLNGLPWRDYVAQ